MPKAQLPHNFKGWVTALLASFVGFMSGFITMRAAEKLWK